MVTRILVHEILNKCNLSLVVIVLHVAERDVKSSVRMRYCCWMVVDRDRVSMGLDSASDVIGTMV